MSFACSQVFLSSFFTSSILNDCSPLNGRSNTSLFFFFRFYWLMEDQHYHYEKIKYVLFGRGSYAFLTKNKHAFNCSFSILKAFNSTFPTDVSHDQAPYFANYAFVLGHGADQQYCGMKLRMRYPLCLIWSSKICRLLSSLCSKRFRTILVRKSSIFRTCLRRSETLATQADCFYMAYL